jgi:hypothetical protein
MKSQIPVFFGRWLTLMEEAYWFLNRKEFLELEKKIKKEVAFRRRRVR